MTVRVVNRNQLGQILPVFQKPLHAVAKSFEFLDLFLSRGSRPRRAEVIPPGIGSSEGSIFRPFSADRNRTRLLHPRDRSRRAELIESQMATKCSKNFDAMSS